MHTRTALSILLASFTICCCVDAQAQILATPQAQILQTVNESNVVTLVGNVHPVVASASASTAADLGTAMSHMVLSLKGTAAQEAALDALITAQNDPKSPYYHQYLTPQAFATQFGAAPADIAKVSAWLEGHGMKVEQVATGNRALVFSGTAAQVNDAFQTEIRQYNVAGVNHLANATEPKIPAAFAAAVGGVVKLHDFRHSSNLSTAKGLTAVKLASGQWTSGSSHYLTPADYGVIYDINPLYSAGINGTGQAIAVIARTDIYLSDVQNFRSTFGLKANDPQFIVTNSDPGVLNGDSTETTLDTEWAGAVAPNAAIKVIISSSGTSDGIDLSSLYAVNNNVAPIITLSYGSCEAGMGSSELSFYNSLWKQAATQGQSVMVSSGDSGAAGCDYGSVAQYGQNVNGLCSSPYSTCVGGTEFADASDPSLYWLPTNSTVYGSAMSYIPEGVWNESGTVSGGSGLWAGGGGASLTYTKPTWQTGTGVPADGKRDVPDVSLTAASHDGYFIALQGSFYTVGGTSAAAPSFAGMVALVNQKMNARQGLLNTTLYPLATKQAAGGAAVFHDIVNGNNSVPGATGFAATAGYDRASGLGTVDANLLVTHWADGGASAAAGLSLSTSASSVTVLVGQTGQATITSTGGGTFKSAVALTVSGAPVGLTATLATTTIASPGSGTDVFKIVTATSVTPGTYNLTVTGTGDGQTATVSVAVVVPAPSYTLAASAATLSVQRGNSGSVTVSMNGQNGFSSAVALTVAGLPSGVTATFTPASISGTTQSVLKLAASSTAAASTSVLTITGTSGTMKQTAVVSLVVVAPSLTLSAGAASVTVQASSSESLIMTITETALTSSVALSVSGLPTGITAAFSPATLSASGSSTLKFTAASTVSAGTYKLTVTAAGGGLTQTAAVSLVVTRIPTCVLASSPASVTLKAGLSASVQLSCGSPSGTFSAPLTVTMAGAPAGMTAQLSANTLTPGATTTLSITPAISMASGTYNLTYGVSGSGFTGTLAIPVTVQAQNILTLTASTMQLNLKPATSGQVTLTTVALGSFNSAIAFTATAPSGLTVSLSKTSLAAPGSGAVVATIAAGAKLAAGNYVVQLTAIGGSCNESVYLAVNISNGPDFSFTVNTTAVSIAQGGTGSFITSSGNYTGGFNGQMTVTINGLPYGANYSVTGANAANNLVNITYGITAAASTPLGTYPVTITASGSGITHSVTVQLTVVSATSQAHK